MVHTTRELIKHGCEKLVASSTSAMLDSQVLLAHLTNKSRTWLLAHPEAIVTTDIENQYYDSIDQMIAGVPLPYIISQWEFYGMSFKLTPDTLIPRPETELIVEHALSWARSHSGDNTVLDIGTGSGCIAIALAKYCPNFHVTALDISHPALIIASHNARVHQVQNRVQFFQADLRVPFPLLTDQAHRFDIICSNPPYIPSQQLTKLPVSQFEPRNALDGGQSGVELISALLTQAVMLLKQDGLFLMEINSSHAEMAVSLTAEHFQGAVIQLKEDLAGKERLVVIENPNIWQTLR
jgi:release factor glutamine methyltransferase